ncbi:MAG: LytR/AlgR family response regulator transcription factor [bacterium]
MKCIIVDDEPLAIEIIESYCNSISLVEVVKTFDNALDAIEFIKSNKTDLIFSDIDMPLLSGIEFVKAIEGQKPYFIFTTAYPEFALEGYDLNIVDYLVKPIPFPRFIKAINRVKDLISLKKASNLNLNISSSGSEKDVVDPFIFVKSDYENIRIKWSNINYIQGLKDYLKIYSEDSKPILTLMNFNTILKKLPDNYFIRVHRSYVVNINKIKSVQKNKIIIGDERLPIGESFRSSVYNRLGI